MTQTTTDTRPVAKRAKPASTAQEHHFVGVGDIEILYRAWRPEGPPRALVVIAPGFNSHGGHYEWVASQFVRQGLAVYAIDHRGRGKSDGERFFVKHVLEYVDDLSTLVNLAKARDPDLPVFLLGHSAGGVISCVYTLEHQDDIDGLICESFAFKVPAPNFALTLIKGLSHVVPRAHVLTLPNKYFSRDPEIVEALNTDPYIANERQPSSTVAALVRADERLAKEFPLITLPVLILHGTADKVTIASGSQFFYDTVGSQDKSLKLYEGHFHDLLNDVDKERVLADVESWIDARLSAS